MNTELLETFLDVFESRNFNRTADRLGIAQSSVSTRISSLEQFVNARLFERGRQGAMPTAAGIRFEEHARLLLASWYHARRDVGAAPGYSSILRLAGQFSLMQSVLVDWVIKLQRQDKHRAIDLQADYSNQIVRDLVAGTLDIALFYSPRSLPDLVIRQEGLESFCMVSTVASKLKNVSPDTYIKPAYTRFFNRTHNEQLPHLSSSLLSVGHEELSLALLNRIGGSSYLPAALAKKMCNESTTFNLVNDAPTISQPIYSAIHIRRQYESDTIAALGALREVLSETHLDTR